MTDEEKLDVRQLAEHLAFEALAYLADEITPPDDETDEERDKRRGDVTARRQAAKLALDFWAKLDKTAPAKGDDPKELDPRRFVSPSQLRQERIRTLERLEALRKGGDE